MDYLRVVRQLGIGAGLIAHINKSDSGDQAPFGSRFWHNSARSTWFLKRAAASQDGQTISLAAFHRKANLGRLRPAVGIEARFDEAANRVRFVRVDAADIEEVAGSLPLWQRLRHALKSQPKTIAELADELESKPDTVKKALTRDKGKAFTLLTNTDDGVQRWGLLDRRAA